MTLPAFAVQRPIATSMFAIALLVFGFISLPNLELTLLPDLAPETLDIWVGVPDASIREIEEGVAVPIEKSLLTVPGVRTVRSDIAPGGVTFRVGLTAGVRADIVGLNARDRLDALRWQLPENVESPVVLDAGGRDTPDLVLAIGGSDIAATGDWARHVLAPRLEQIDGVARATVIGAPEREITIVPEPERLRSLGIGVTDIAGAIARANVPSSGGYLRRHEIRFAVDVKSALTTPEEVRDVVVTRIGDRAVRVGDIASVTDGTDPEAGVSRLDGEPAVGVLVYRVSGANVVTMAGAVHERLADIRSEFPDFAVAVVNDPSPFVRQSMQSVWMAAVLGGVLAYAALVAFLRDRRSPLFLMLVIPVSVIPTFALLDVFGVSLNLMSLGGIALGVGMLVDNGIVCLENIHRLRESGRHPRAAAAIGAEEVALPMLASTLTTCAVFLPLAWVPGTIGDLFRDQAIAVSVSLMVSLVIALTVLPMLAAHVPPPLTSGRMPFYGGYHAVLTHALRRPGLALGGALLLLALGVAVLASRPKELFPDMATENVEIQLTLPPGTDLPATNEATVMLEAWLRDRPEVDRVYATVGTGQDAFHRPTPANRASIRARLHAHGTAERANVIAELNDFVARHPTWRTDVLPDRPELATLYGDDLPTLTIEVSGRDSRVADDVALALANEASRRMKAGEPFRLATGRPEPHIHLTPDRDAFRRLGVSESPVVDAIQAATSGLDATTVRRFDDEDPVVIRTPNGAHPRQASIAIDGRTIPLSALFSDRTELLPADIRREDQARVAAIRWDGSMRDVDRAKRAVAEALEASGLPAGYTLRMGGAHARMMDTLHAITRAFLLSVGLVLLILAAQFESVRLPFIIFAAVPLAAVGCAVALALSNGSVNALSGIGFVVLIGIVVNDAILKVDLLRRLRQEGMPLDVAIQTASRRRYRPILMTTATTSLALVPLLFGRGAEFRAPMAVTTIGGLVSATLLTLIVVPLLFRLVSRDPSVGDAR